MRIDFERKIVFIMNPKCGCDSIQTALLQLGFKSPILDFPYNGDGEKWGGTVWHSSLKSAVKVIKNRKEDPHDYYFFMFTRNPWDRLVSLYEYRVQVLKTIKNATFEQWLRWTFISNDNIKNKGKYLYYTDLVTKEEQIEYKVNIFRLEDIQEALSKIEEKTGLKIPLLHKNTTRHSNYRNYYDQNLRNLVATHFKKEIEQHNYTF